MKITVIGAGNMGGAIAYGSLRSGIVCYADLTISDPNNAMAEKLKAEGYTVNYTDSNVAAVKGADIIIVAVKPWLIEEVLGQISPVVNRQEQVVVSIAAGVTFDSLNQYIGGDRYGGMGIFRVIPNTAIWIGKGATFISTFNTSAEQEDMVTGLFRTMGRVFKVAEGQMAAVTALSSSGIAYAYKYIAASMDGGTHLGLEENFTREVVLATVEGAVAMLENNGTMPQEEIDKVTTPGGITLKGLQKMEDEGFTQAVVEGLLATK